MTSSATTWKASPNVAFEAAQTGRYTAAQDGEERTAFGLVCILSHVSQIASGITPHNKHLGHTRKQLVRPTGWKLIFLGFPLYRMFLSSIIFYISSIYSWMIAI